MEFVADGISAYYWPGFLSSRKVFLVLLSPALVWATATILWAGSLASGGVRKDVVSIVHDTRLDASIWISSAALAAMLYVLAVYAIFFLTYRISRMRRFPRREVCWRLMNALVEASQRDEWMKCRRRMLVIAWLESAAVCLEGQVRSVASVVDRSSAGWFSTHGRDSASGVRRLTRLAALPSEPARLELVDRLGRALTSLAAGDFKMTPDDDALGDEQEHQSVWRRVVAELRVVVIGFAPLLAVSILTFRGDISGDLSTSLLALTGSAAGFSLLHFIDPKGVERHGG
jgi:HAMP domain-containing protein